VFGSPDPAAVLFQVNRLLKTNTKPLTSEKMTLPTTATEAVDAVAPNNAEIQQADCERGRILPTGIGSTSMIA
jgi:hypothetical protein